METETQPVGWDSRPSGGTMFKPGRRHLYRVTDSEPDRTLCGVTLPRAVRQHLRGVRPPVGGMVGVVVPMDSVELEDAQPCQRCHR